MKKLKMFGLEELENNAEDVAATLPTDNFESEALIPDAELGHDADDLEAHAEGIAEAGQEATEATAAVDTGFDVTQNLTELAATMESILADRSSNVNGASILFVKGVNHQLSRLGLSAARCVPAFESLENETAELEKVIVATADGEVSSDTKDRTEENEPTPTTVDDGGAGISNTEVKDVTTDATGIVLAKADDLNPEDRVEAAAVNADAAAIAVEGLIDTVSKVVSKIIDHRRKVRQSITDNFARIFTGLEAIRRRAYAQRLALKKVAGSPKSENMTGNGLHRLAVDGKVDPKSILKGLDNTEKLTTFMFNDYAKDAGSFFKAYADVFVKHENLYTKEDETKFVDLLDKEKGKFIAKIVASVKGHNYTISGDRSLMAGDHEVGVYLGKNKEAPSVLSKQSVATPTLKEIDAVLQNVIAIVENGRREHEVIGQLFDIQEKAINEAMQASSNVKIKKRRDEMEYKLAMLGFHFITPITDVSSYTFTTLRSALVYAEKGAAQYKAE